MPDQQELGGRQSTKDRLLARRLPTVQHRIRVDFDADPDDPDAYVVLELRAIAPQAAEDLIDAHPPTAADYAHNPNAAWSRATYVPALLAACSVDPELDELFWWELWTNERAADHAGGDDGDASQARVTQGEVWEMFRTCQRINDRSPELRTGKG